MMDELDLNNSFIEEPPLVILENQLKPMLTPPEMKDQELLDFVCNHVEELKKRVKNRTCKECKDNGKVSRKADTWLKETIFVTCPSCHGNTDELREKYEELVDAD